MIVFQLNSIPTTTKGTNKYDDLGYTTDFRQSLSDCISKENVPFCRRVLIANSYDFDRVPCIDWPSAS